MNLSSFIKKYISLAKENRGPIAGIFWCLVVFAIYFIPFYMIYHGKESIFEKIEEIIIVLFATPIAVFIIFQLLIIILLLLVSIFGFIEYFFINEKQTISKYLVSKLGPLAIFLESDYKK